MKMRAIMTVMAATAIAACATERDSEVSEKAAAELAKYEATGETRACLQLRAIDSIKAIDDRHLLIEMRSGDLYLNKTNGRCTGATDIGTRLQYQTSLSQLCQNEIVRVVDNLTGIERGGCGLNEFEAVQEKETE
ncbi:MAG: DUF6491 family protein [Pseudomonadota bacterium]